MSDIFGPETKLKGLERNVAETIINGKNVLYPIVDDDEDYHLQERTYDAETQFGSRYDKDKINSLFSKDGILIPFDFVQLPRSDWSKLGDSDEEYGAKLFLGRPDFLYVSNDSSSLHIFPVDVKGGYDGARNSANQISMYNSAMLYFHSRYMRDVVNFLKKKFDKKVVFENGFFLTTTESSHDKTSLDAYLEENLLHSVQPSLRDEKLGIEFISGEPKLIVGPEEAFSTNSEYSFSLLKEAELVNHLGFAKNRIGDLHVYPNILVSINGFNGGQKPIFRLNYNPSGRIETSDPLVDILGDELNEIHSLQPDEVLKRLPKLEISSDERRIRRLEIELEAKLIDKFYFERNAQEQDFFIYCKPSTVKDRQRRYNKFLRGKEKKINTIKTEVEKNKQIVHNQRKKAFEVKFEKGTNEWHLAHIHRRKQLIQQKKTDLDNLKDILRKREHRDVSRFNDLVDFDVSCGELGDFSLAYNPKYPLPAELYLQLNTREVGRVLLFNTEHIGK